MLGSTLTRELTSRSAEKTRVSGVIPGAVSVFNYWLAVETTSSRPIETCHGVTPVLLPNSAGNTAKSESESEAKIKARMNEQRMYIDIHYPVFIAPCCLWLARLKKPLCDMIIE